MVVKTSLRYAHSEGLTQICVDIMTKKIFTCGSDGDARIWQDFEMDDPISIRAGENATAVCAYDDKMYVADENGTINVFQLPSASNDGLVTKFPLPVNHMAISLNGDRILVGCSDFSIKLINVHNKHQITLGIGENFTHPTLSASLDPLSEYAATSSCDGHVRIWSVAHSSKSIQSWKILPVYNDISIDRPLARLQWRPVTGDILAVPTGSSVYLYARNTWTMIKKLELDDTEETFSVCSFSDDGRYLAAGSMKGRIIVWDSQLYNVILSETHPKQATICNLIWHPIFNDRLIYCDTNGQVGVLKEFLPKNVDDVILSASSNVLYANEDHSKSNLSKDDVIKRVKIDRSPVKKKKYNDSDDDDVSCDSDIGALKSHYNSKIFGGDDDVIDDVTSNDQHHVTKFSGSTPTPSLVVGPSWKPKTPQAPFVPGSTPEHLSERFIKWNSIGIIRQYKNSTEDSYIEIEYHDVTMHHARQLNNSVFEYCLGDLSDEAVALANHASRDRPSRLFILHVGAWDSSKDWSTTLPDGEDAVCLALGHGWLAVASKNRNVWLFTVAGVQFWTFSVPHDILTMAAHDQRLLIAFCDGFDSDGNPQYSSTLIETVMQISKHPLTTVNLPLPLTRESDVSWLGFSSEGSPCVCDSAGCLKIFKNSSWIQIYNANLASSDFLWVTSVHETLPQQQIRGIRCKFAHQRYPSFLPRPTISLMPWCLNLCEKDTDKTNQEEICILSTLRVKNLHKSIQEDVDDLSVDLAECQKIQFQAILKLFLLACNSERDCRALEIAKLAESVQSLNTLANIALKKNRRVLADKISELATHMLLQQEKVQESRDFLVAPSNTNMAHTQPLFGTEDEYRNGQISENVEYRRKAINADNGSADSTNNLHIKHEAEQARPDTPDLHIKDEVKPKFQNFASSGLTSNPFKKSSVNPNDESNDSTTNIFDKISISSKKRPSSSGTPIFSENEELNGKKKQKTITLKKQAKLSFGYKIEKQ